MHNYFCFLHLYCLPTDAVQNLMLETKKGYQLNHAYARLETHLLTHVQFTQVTLQFKAITITNSLLPT